MVTEWLASATAASRPAAAARRRARARADAVRLVAARGRGPFRAPTGAVEPSAVLLVAQHHQLAVDAALARFGGRGVGGGERRALGVGERRRGRRRRRRAGGRAARAARATQHSTVAWSRDSPTSA